MFWRYNYPNWLDEILSGGSEVPIYEFEGKRPIIGEGTFIHPEATLIGDVKIGPRCYIGAGARLRADWGRIRVGEGCNIQDNCVIHTDVDETVVLGPGCHIGHGSILHGPTLEARVFVGMGAIIMDGVRVGEGSCIGAGSLVTAGISVPAGTLMVGVPAQATGKVGDDLAVRLRRGRALYQELAGRCLQGLKRVDP